MSSVVFLGDTALPTSEAVDIDPIRPLLEGKQLVINLEGPVLDGPVPQVPVNDPYKINLHSCSELLDVLESIGVAACCLANNHINDYVGGVRSTIAKLESAGVAAFGTEDRPIAELESDGRRLFLLGACSPLPERRTFPHDANPRLFRPGRLLEDVAGVKKAHPDARIACVIHWGYELSLYPEPADREWARRAIDAGADCVIGHHPHVVQGVEWYREGLIAYSLGNFLLPQVDFNGRRLRYFAEEVLVELGIEIDVDDRARLHWFRYDDSGGRLLPLTAAGGFDAEQKLRDVTPFAGMSDTEYRRWFAAYGARGHLTKRRGGPVYQSYFGVRRVSSSTNDLLMLGKRRVRRTMIRLGLHRPYNW